LSEERQTKPSRRGVLARDATFVFGGLACALEFRRDKPLRAYLASGLALFAALATAAVGIFPNILPARDPNHGLSIYDSAVSRHGLAVALWWWLPGMLLVAGYFAFIHSRMAKGADAKLKMG
jgi:cytochrome bd-type quinol oxidase subunit 2